MFTNVGSMGKFKKSVSDGYVAPIIDVLDSLIAHYKFEEGAGGTTADDVGSNNGTLFGNTNFVAGKVGNYAVDFDGSGDRITTPMDGLGSGPTAFSVATWFTAASFGNGSLFSQYTDQEGFSLGTIDAGGHKMYVYKGVVGATNGSPTGTTILELDTWYHAGFTVSATGVVSVFLNGVKENSVIPAGTASWAPASYTCIGALDPTRNYWDGKIDDMRIYNRELSEVEFFNIYNLFK